MANSLTHWLRRDPGAAGRHVRVMPATTVPGAAPALVATATQVVIAAENEQGARALVEEEPLADRHAPDASLLAPEPPFAEPVQQPPIPEPAVPEGPATSSAAVPSGDAAEPVVAPAEQPLARVVAVQPPPFEPPPWDLPAPAAPPVAAETAAPVLSATARGARKEPHPVALEFSDGARFELDEDDPRFGSFLAAAAAVTGAAHDHD